MAKINKNSILHGISGRLGNLVFSQMSDGSTRVSERPAYQSRKTSQKQKDNRKQFQQASWWAKAASKDYPIYAELARNMPNVTAYNVALADARKPPVIHCVERRDGVIRVQASDNVLVADVRVEIMDADGRLIEEGLATQVDPEWWEYTPKKQGTVVAVAHDLPWNATRVNL